VTDKLKTRSLAAYDRDGAAGRRDYAILLMMARLALRGGEAARLQLPDIDWRAAELTICGKDGRTDALPLPADVGEAIAGCGGVGEVEACCAVKRRLAGCRPMLADRCGYTASRYIPSA